MKIDRKTLILGKDEENRWAVEADAELRWMFRKIQEGYAEIREKRKELFYKEQMFRSYYKDHCHNFSPSCSAKMIFDFYENGKFGPEERKKPESKQILNCIVVNYFPEWMWEDLKFEGAVCEGWDMHGIELHFRWKHKSRATAPMMLQRKKPGSAREIDFCISLKNPDSVRTGETFDSSGALEEEKRVLPEDYRTKVTVCVDVVAAEKTHTWDYDWVCAAYLNDEIVAGINKWAGKFVGRESPEEKGKGDSNGAV
jgi:hypothetical protein